ncbi:MAG TPA: hypothetical protein VF645_06640 [Allosphingosinicella sp.]|jgi:hypothetical protein
MISERLRERFGDRIANALAQRLESGEAPVIEPREFAAALGGSHSPREAADFLEAAAAEGLLAPVDVHWCPKLLHRLDEDDLDNGRCAACGVIFSETGEEPVPGRIYSVAGELSRDIDWLIVVHGFNTRGWWQEEFSWRIANKLRYSAPTLIYKYGLIRLGVLFGFRHRQLARHLGLRIRQAVAQAREQGRGERPNAVIHSFGSKLFITLLDLPEFRDLRFGRVIAAGSVVPPDYDWSRRIAQARVEAVMNHCGGRDLAVPFAHFTIPGTGPSGRHGFSDPATINILDPDYGHSSCFSPEALALNLGKDGVWDRFLRRPLDRFSDPRLLSPDSVQWRPRRISSVLSRATIMILLIALALAGALMVVTCAGELLRHLGLG